jgi:lipoprotein signal peptidase
MNTLPGDAERVRGMAFWPAETPAGMTGAGRVVPVSARGTRSRPVEAPPRVTGRPVQKATSARPLGVRGRWAWVLCLLIVLVDQATKAVQPTGTLFVNTGGWTILPSAVSDALWGSQTFGAACDTVDTVLLLAGLRMAGRLANTRQRLAATALLAGLLSNLIDRLGGASLFHPGLPRGAIDWIPVPAWSTARMINVADIVIVLAALTLAYQPARRAIQAIQALVRGSRPAHLAGAAAGLIAVAIWTTAWQANRYNAEIHPTAPSEIVAACTQAARIPTPC